MFLPFYPPPFLRNTMTLSPSKDLFCAAVITSAHGLQGHVKVKCFLENPQDFKNYSAFCNEEGQPLFTLKKVLSQDQDRLLISLEGVGDRTQAEALKGTFLRLPRETLKKLPEDQFYYQDLISLEVRSHKEHSLGQVHAMHNFGAGDILEIRTLHQGLVMIPFTHGLVPLIQIEAGFVQLSEEGEESLNDH